MTSPTIDRRFGLVGNSAFKAPVTALASSNITQSGQQAVDGISVLASNAAGVPDRVLCMGQTDATKNGIWDVSTGPWTRSKDSDGNYDLTQGSTVLVNQGTANAGTYWRVTTSGLITIGTTSITWGLALASSLTTSTFTAAGTSAVARTGQDKMRDWVSVKDFGAKGDGVTNDLAAFTAALAASDVVIVPPGNYAVNGPIVMNTRKKLFGVSRGGCIITNTTTNTACIQGTASGLDIHVRSLSLKRSVTPVDGGYGLDFRLLCGESAIEDLNVAGHWHAVLLGPTDFSRFEDSIVENNLGIGVFISNIVTGFGALGWQLSNLLVQSNNSHGFLIQSAPAVGIVAQGSGVRLASYLNGGYGYCVQGSAGSPLASVRLTDCFFGNDALGEIFLDTYQVQHKISNCFLELAGQGNTGAFQVLPATNTGHGITITANNNYVSIQDCEISDMSWDGINTQGKNVQVTGCRILDCGRVLTVGSRNGINHNQATGVLQVVGNVIGDSGTGNQVNGIFTGADNMIVTGNNLIGNTNGISTSVTLVASAVIGNLPATVASVHPNGMTGFTTSGIVVGAATGGNLGAGTVNVHTSVSKDNAAYTNP